MGDKQVLDRLEHRLLSMQIDDSEPLFVLYSDTMRDVPGATLDSVLEALVRLIKMNLITCQYVDAHGERKPCPRVAFLRLKQHCSGRSEEELRNYPEYGGEFEFEPTLEGRTEEARAIYNDYYPEVDGLPGTPL